MSYLSREQRRQLESTVREARRQAEAGARAVLTHLGVAQASAFEHSTAVETDLRERLRARARQLGDVGDNTLGQGFARLVTTTAYEHWHRMLFARFLAERGLLLHDSGVAVSLDDCEDLVRDEGSGVNKWVLAGRYASAMLPQIFRPDDPVLAVALPAEYQQELERLLAGLGVEVFKANDALGWVYQFWQAQKKEEVNRSEVKIGADELPAVTQLFTEPYMVQFLLHNTLGAWWAGKVLAVDDALATTAADEAALRSACSVAGVEWTYLRFVREDGRWRPAAGAFDGWPKGAKDILVLDPCCGSGHFLVGMLEILGALRAAEEGLDAAAACDAVLRDNLHGLEIDPRCTELAAFAVALSAWSLPGHEGVRPLPELRIACSGLSLGVSGKEFRTLGDDRRALSDELDRLYQNFEHATVLGSLIQPRRALGSLFEAGAEKATAMLKERADAERRGADSARRELAVTAYGAATAAQLLTGRYVLVATNVPYLVSGKQSDLLKSYCETHHHDGRGDLATVFVDRCVKFCKPAGTIAVVTPQSWLFQGSYKAIRTRLLANTSWNALAKLGARAFETITGEVVSVALVALTDQKPRSAHAFAAADVSAAESPKDKSWALQEGPTASVRQVEQNANADARIQFATTSGLPMLAPLVDCHQGLATGDLERFSVQFWEVSRLDARWVPWQGTVASIEHFGGRSAALRWDDGRGPLHAFNEENKAVRKNTHLRGVHVRGKLGVLISQMGQVPTTIYTGEHFDDSTTVMVPRAPLDVPTLWAFCSSSEFSQAVRRLDTSLKVPAHTLAKVPFDLPHWQAVAAAKYPHGLPKPFSSDPTQWLFSGQPKGSDHPLQVAVARLCGYRWPRQTGSAFPDCPALGPDGLESLTDDDGIVCLPAVGGERPAADRLQDLLAAAWGKDWSHAVLHGLLDQVGYADKGLDAWLDKAFFEQHCKLFQHRPFIWHVWDGVRGGFSALVHYQRLDRKTLERLTYTYLGDWIQRQEHAVRGGEDGAQERVAAARNLQAELERILEGEKGYDIFVRWKPLAQQPIGWEPDLDDGVRLNIRPFMLARDVGQRDAGILRWKPNVHWKKDRGQDVPSAPWFGKFGGEKGERVNDWHLGLAEKRAARLAAS
jgi:hypothetical protein